MSPFAASPELLRGATRERKLGFPRMLATKDWGPVTPRIPASKGLCRFLPALYLFVMSYAAKWRSRRFDSFNGRVAAGPNLTFANGEKSRSLNNSGIDFRLAHKKELAFLIQYSPGIASGVINIGFVLFEPNDLERGAAKRGS